MNSIKNLDFGTKLIILIGIISLFGDFTYESARSIIPQYFTTILGGSVFLLGIVVGVGEFVGYSFRIVSGEIIDKTHFYWGVMIIGYIINMVAVPMLAISGNYIFASALIILERFGKALRTPPRDYLISIFAERESMGKGFAIQQVLDQTGAVVGPLIVSFILLLGLGYRDAFLFLAFPASLCLLFVFITYFKGRNFSVKERKIEKPSDYRKFIYFYSAGIGIASAGIYHISFVLYTAQSYMSEGLIPIIFMVAMIGEGAIGGLSGLLYDKLGKNLVYIGILLSLILPILMIHPDVYNLFIAGFIFGAITGIYDTVGRSIIGKNVEEGKRGFAYGVYNTFYGMGLFFSGLFIGYFFNFPSIIFSYVFILQLLSIPILFYALKHTG